MQYVPDSAIPWTIQSMEYPRPEYWSGWPFPSRGSSQPRDQIQVSHTAGGFFTDWVIRETLKYPIETLFSDGHWDLWLCSERIVEFKNNFISDPSQFTPNQIRCRRGNTRQFEVNRYQTTVVSAGVDPFITRTVAFLFFPNTFWLKDYFVR